MKRILTLLFLGSFFVQAQAQVLFSQDFESGSIEPMTAVDVDGKTVHPNVAAIAGPTFQTYQNGANSHVVVSTSWFNPVGQADDWLISPPIEVTDANTFLIWEAWSPDASFRDGYQVRVSTTDNEVASFTELALNVAAELTTLTQRSVSLAPYVGQTIHFAFRNNSNDKFLLYMDNIRVVQLKNNNTILRNVVVEKYSPTSVEIPVKITLENYGAQPLTSLIFKYTVNGYPYVDSVSGLNVAPLKTYDLTHTISAVLPEAGVYDLNVNLTMPNGVEDEDSTDNVGTKLVYGLSEAVAKRVFVEEATGTWCQWCPRGAVFMDLIYEQYPDIALPVAVHNFDPMTIAEYDGPFSASVGGYPSGHVDRKLLDIDPSEFPDAIASIQDRLVPVLVTTDVAWDPDTRTATITGKGTSTVTTSSNDFRFACVITEDDVRGTTADYAQVNIYAGGGQGAMGGYENLANPVPAAQMVYHFVARALLGGFNGMENSVPDEVVAGEEFEIVFTYQVPEGYDENEMRAIILLMDEETGEVLNGEKADITGGVSVPLVPQGRFVAYPNPTTDILNLEVDYQTDVQVQMAIYTTYGGLVRDLGRIDLSNGKQIRQINVADLTTGNYILEMRNKNAVTALPFTKI